MVTEALTVSDAAPILRHLSRENAPRDFFADTYLEVLEVAGLVVAVPGCPVGTVKLTAAGLAAVN